MSAGRAWQNLAVQLVRQFNASCPYHQPKHLLSKRIDSLVTDPGSPHVFHRIEGDLAMRLDLSVYCERWIYLNCYSLVTVRLLRRLLQPGDVYVDAGANLGLLALVAARAVGDRGRVYAFEPSESTRARLEENLRLNQTINVEVIPHGCWDRRGQSPLHDFADGHCGETSMQPIPDRSVARTRQIETVRIDEVVQRRVRVLKLDVEGAEWPALRGAQRLLEQDLPPHLIVELNPRTCRAFGYHPRELVDWLLQLPARYEMHLIKCRRKHPLTAQQLHDRFAREPDKFLDVWFRPSGLSAGDHRS